MADQLRLCPECNKFVHVSKMHVGWRGCADCEGAKMGMMADLGIVEITPDQSYAANERKIWKYAKDRGLKVDRLI